MLPVRKGADAIDWIMISPFLIIVIISIILCVVSMIWNQYPILPVAVLLLAVAMLIGKGA